MNKIEKIKNDVIFTNLKFQDNDSYFRVVSSIRNQKLGVISKNKNKKMILLHGVNCSSM